MRYMLPILLLALNVTAIGQTDTTNKTNVSIERSLQSFFEQTDSGMVSRLLGDVIIRHGADYLYCDSAHINQETNSLEAYVLCSPAVQMVPVITCATRAGSAMPI